jgi:Skp family chaperone for outer membrane proteins
MVSGVRSKFISSSFIYLAALGVAKANDLQCVDKAKEAARKVYGNCLADQKTTELQELRKSYQAELMKMKEKYEQEVAALKAERAALRKGILKAKKLENETQPESVKSGNTVAPKKEDSALDITTPQVTLKTVEGSKVEISPLQDGNSVELPEPTKVESVE